MARLIASGKESPQLTNVVVIRVKGGQSSYVTVTARYARSAFGNSLNALTHCPRPVCHTPFTPPLSPSLPGRELPPPHSLLHKQSPALSEPFEAGDKADEAGTTLHVPKELWRMINALRESGACLESGLFSEEGIQSEVEGIREAIDTGDDFPPHGVHSMIETLVTFLSSLSPPVVTLDMCPDGSAVDPQDVPSRAHEFLERLGPMEYNTFVCMMSFFRELLQHSKTNGLNPATLVLVHRACMTPDYLHLRAGKDMLAGGPEPQGSVLTSSRVGAQVPRTDPSDGCRGGGGRGDGSGDGGTGLVKCSWMQGVKERCVDEEGAAIPDNELVRVDVVERGSAVDQVVEHLLTAEDAQWETCYQH